jgi:ribosomal protein L15
MKHHIEGLGRSDKCMVCIASKARPVQSSEGGDGDGDGDGDRDGNGNGGIRRKLLANGEGIMMIKKYTEYRRLPKLGGNNITVHKKTNVRIYLCKESSSLPGTKTGIRLL